MSTRIRVGKVTSLLLGFTGMLVEVGEVRGQLESVGGQNIWCQLSRGLGKAARIDIDISQQFPLALRQHLWQHLQPRWFSVARLFQRRRMLLARAWADWR